MSQSDVQELRRLMAEHGAKVLGAAEAYADGSVTVEDIFQETFIRAWKRMEHVMSHPCIAGWLCQTALNVGRDLQRKEERRRSLFSRWGRPLQSKQPRTVGEELVRRALWRAIDGLPRQQRRVILLRYVDELDSSEIGATMGITAGTVRASLRDAQRSLRKALGVERPVRADGSPGRASLGFGEATP